MSKHQNKPKKIWAIVCSDWRLTATQDTHEMSQEFIDYLASRGWDHVYMSRCFGPEVKINDLKHREWWAEEAEDAVNIGHAELAVIFGHNTCGKFTAANYGLGLELDQEDSKHWEFGSKSTEIIASLSGLPVEYLYHKPGQFLEQPIN